MPDFFLRKITSGYLTFFESVKSGTEFHDISGFEWVPQGQQPADLLSAFPIKKGEVSLYKIEDKDNTELRLSILSSIHKGNAPSGSDCIIIDLSFIEDTDIAMTGQTRSDTGIKWVDELHYDLIHITIDHIVMLASSLPKIIVDADTFAQDEILEKYQELAHQQSSK